MNIRKIRLGLAACACLAVLAASPAVTSVPAEAAQCGRADQIVSYLSKKYKEQVKGMGVVGSKGFMQLFVAESGTWTVLLTSPEGISCIVAAGDNFETIPLAAVEPNA